MSNSGKKSTDEDDVEQLLRAAQEDVLLKLSVNSHMARGSAAAAINTDLDRRFQALKKPQKLTKRDDSAKITPKKAGAGAGAPADDGDLYARFAALKNSLPSNSSSSSQRDVSTDQKATDELDEEEGEVEKVIKWAIDAARLDPSPISDDDHRSDDESDYSSDDGVDRGKKSKMK